MIKFNNLKISEQPKILKEFFKNQRFYNGLLEVEKIDEELKILSNSK